VSDSKSIPSAPTVIGAMAFAAAPGVEHVAVAGDLSEANVGAFESALDAIRLETLVVVLDLSAVTSLDDDARWAIVAAWSRLRADGRRMLLIAPESLRDALDAGPRDFERANRWTARLVGRLPRARGQRRTVATRARLPRRASDP
jgi:anti-anti-sigma regulatory factor